DLLAVKMTSPDVSRKDGPQAATVPGVVNATDVIALIALVVSIGAGVVAGISLLLQFKESQRRGAELGPLCEQVDLVRQQVGSGQQARFAVFAGVQGSGSERGIEYTIPVQNVGESGASRITVELVDGHGTTVGTTAEVLTLVPGEKGYAVVVT